MACLTAADSYNQQCLMEEDEEAIGLRGRGFEHTKLETRKIRQQLGSN